MTSRLRSGTVVARATGILRCGLKKSACRVMNADEGPRRGPRASSRDGRPRVARAAARAGSGAPRAGSGARAPPSPAVVSDVKATNEKLRAGIAGPSALEAENASLRRELKEVRDQLSAVLLTTVPRPTAPEGTPPSTLELAFVAAQLQQTRRQVRVLSDALVDRRDISIELEGALRELRQHDAAARGWATAALRRLRHIGWAEDLADSSALKANLGPEAPHGRPPLNKPPPLDPKVAVGGSPSLANPPLPLPKSAARGGPTHAGKNCMASRYGMGEPKNKERILESKARLEAAAATGRGGPETAPELYGVGGGPRRARPAAAGAAPAAAGRARRRRRRRWRRRRRRGRT